MPWMPSRPPIRVRGALLLVALVLAVGSVRHYRDDVHPANEAIRIYAALAIVDHGTVALDPVFDEIAPGWRESGGPPNRDAAVRDGRHLLDKAPGLTLAAVPVIAGLRALGLRPGFGDLAWGLTLLFCALPTAMFGALLARRLRTDPATAAAPGWLPGALIVATPWMAYGGLFFGHAAAAALVGTGALLGLGRFGPGRQDAGGTDISGRASPERPHRDGFLAGLALGAAVLVEHPALVPAVMVALGIVADRDARRRAPSLAAGAALGAAALLAWNAGNFGHPLAMSYGFKHDETFAAFHAQGVFGVSWPSLERIGGLLVGARRGLLFLAPWLAVGIAGAGAAAFDRGLTRGWRFALASIGLGFPLLMAGFVDWTAGASMGPRHLLAGLAAPGIAAARLVARVDGTRAGTWLRPAAVGAVLSSAAFCAAGAWVFPYFDSRVANPLFDVSLPVLLESGFAPTFFNAWLPGAWGAVPAAIAVAAALGSGRTQRPGRRGQEAAVGEGRPPPRTGIAWALVLAVAVAHAGLGSLPRSRGARELRGVLATRAAAFEMLDRKDLASPLRKALERTPPR